MDKAKGFDVDGVISLLPREKKQILLTKKNDKILGFFQQFKLLQQIYNRLCRVPNPEIKAAMNELKKRGYRVVIISAASEVWRKTMSKWLQENGFLFDELYFRKDINEDFLSYKKRMVFGTCDFYVDDMETIVDFLKKNNGGNGNCRILRYQRQKKEEIVSLSIAPQFAP